MQAAGVEFGSALILRILKCDDLVADQIITWGKVGWEGDVGRCAGGKVSLCPGIGSSRLFLAGFGDLEPGSRRGGREGGARSRALGHVRQDRALLNIQIKLLIGAEVNVGLTSGVKPVNAGLTLPEKLNRTSRFRSCHTRSELGIQPTNDILRG